MHAVGKVFMGIGVFVILGGVLLMVIGGENIEDAGEKFNELEEYELEQVTSGTITIYDKDGVGDLGLTFYVQGEYTDFDNNGVWDHCDSTEITITEKPSTNSDWDESKDGDFYFEVDSQNCDANEDNKDEERSDQGLIKIGRACLACYSGDISFTSNAEVWVVYDDELVGKALEGIGEAIGGGLQGAAGFMGICCGVVVFGFGLILGLLVNNQQKVIVQNAGMPMNNVMMQANQTTMTQPVYQKNYADVPVQPQTTIQQPQGDNFWNQEEPKNPF